MMSLGNSGGSEITSTQDMNYGLSTASAGGNGAFSMPISTSRRNQYHTLNGPSGLNPNLNKEIQGEYSVDHDQSAHFLGGRQQMNSLFKTNVVPIPVPTMSP